jgi:hypothetical protein
VGLVQMNSTNKNRSAGAALTAVTSALAVATLVIPFVAWSMRSREADGALFAALAVTIAILLIILTLETRVSVLRQRSGAGKPSVASLLYCEMLERGVRRAGVVVVCGAIASLIILTSRGTSASDAVLLLAMTPCVLFALSVIWVHLLRARVEQGAFGTNRVEAIAMIDYIIRNADRLRGDDDGTGLISETPLRSVAGASEAARLALPTKSSAGP